MRQALTSLIVLHLAAGIRCCAGGVHLLAPSWQRDAGQHVLTGPQLLPGHAAAAPMPEVHIQHPTGLNHSGTGASHFWAPAAATESNPLPGHHTMPLDASRATPFHTAQTSIPASAAPAPAAWTSALVPAQGAHGQAPSASASPAARLLRGLLGSASQLRAAAAQHHVKAVAAACATSSSSSSSQGQRRLPRKLLQWEAGQLHTTAAQNDMQAVAATALPPRKLLQQDAASPAAHSPAPQVADSTAASRAWAAGTSDSTAISGTQEPLEPGVAAAAVLAAHSSAPQAQDSTTSSSAWAPLEPGLAAAAGALAASSMPAAPPPPTPVASRSPSSLSLGLNMEVRQHKQILIVIGFVCGTVVGTLVVLSLIFICREDRCWWLLCCRPRPHRPHRLPGQAGPLEQRRLRNMEAGISLPPSPRAAKPPTLVVQPDNELVCARKLSAVLGGGCSPQGLCLASSPRRGIPALMQLRGALDAIGPQRLQGQAEWLELDVTQLMHSQPSWTEDDDSICADFPSSPSGQAVDPRPAGSSSAAVAHQHGSRLDMGGGNSSAARHATGSTATSRAARPATVSRFAGDRVLLWHCGPDVSQNGPGTCSIEIHSE